VDYTVISSSRLLYINVGFGWPLFGEQTREYIYACPLLSVDRWPISLSIITSVGQRNRTHSTAVPVQVPSKSATKKPLAACVQVAYNHVDPVRLVEWLELQRILGVNLVGVYLMTNFSQSSERVFRYARSST